MNILYCQGKKASYVALPEKKANTLYFCTDTRELYKGSDLFTDGIRLVGSYAALPEFVFAADGKLYVCEDTGCGYVLSTTRDSWIQVLFGADNDTIEVNSNGLLSLKEVPIEKVTGLEEKLAELEAGHIQVPIATTEVAGIVKASDEVLVSVDGSMSIGTIDQSKIAGLEDRLAEIEAAAVGGIHYKGSVPTFEDLPADAKQGDLYEVLADGTEWCYTGTEWIEYGSASGLKPIAKADVNSKQFAIENDMLNIIQVDSNIVAYRDRTMTEAMDEMMKSLTWGEIAVPAEAGNVINIIAEVEDGVAIQITRGTIETAMTLEKSVTMIGAASGLAQNYYQEV